MSYYNCLIAIVVALLPTAALASEVEDAVEFIETGDRGWAGSGIHNVIALRSCVTGFVQDFSIMGATGGSLMIAHDWKLVIWASGRFEHNTDNRDTNQTTTTTSYIVQCHGECGGAQSSGGNQGFDLLALRVPRTSIQLLLSVSEERFTNAINILSRACPGYGSKF
jgi:hypothetical protein